MTNPVLEDDVVERLKYLASGSQLWEAGELSGIFRQSFTLIERLQKELGEARDKLNVAILDGAAAAWDRDTIRQQTIEDCAKIAEERAEEGEYGTWQGQEGLIIAKAIRSMDGGGK